MLLVLSLLELIQQFHWSSGFLTRDLFNAVYLVSGNLIAKVFVFRRLLSRFGEESMSRVLRWMAKAKIPENAAILDIGTGNGAFLVELV